MTDVVGPRREDKISHCEFITDEILLICQYRIEDARDLFGLRQRDNKIQLASKYRFSTSLHLILLHCRRNLLRVHILEPRQMSKVQSLAISWRRWKTARGLMIPVPISEAQSTEVGHNIRLYQAHTRSCGPYRNDPLDAERLHQIPKWWDQVVRVDKTHSAYVVYGSLPSILETVKSNYRTIMVDLGVFRPLHLSRPELQPPVFILESKLFQDKCNSQTHAS